MYGTFAASVLPTYLYVHFSTAGVLIKSASISVHVYKSSYSVLNCLTRGKFISRKRNLCYLFIYLIIYFFSKRPNEAIWRTTEVKQKDILPALSICPNPHIMYKLKMCCKQQVPLFLSFLKVQIAKMTALSCST